MWEKVRALPADVPAEASTVAFLFPDFPELAEFAFSSWIQISIDLLQQEIFHVDLLDESKLGFKPVEMFFFIEQIFP